jgi:hypothetical protein
VRLRPLELPGIKLQIAALDRAVVSFDGVADSNQTCGILLFAGLWILRRGYGKTHRIPLAFARRPGAAGRVAKIAEGFQNRLWRGFVLVLRRRAAAAPSATQRQARGMRPVSIREFFRRHEVRTGQVVSHGFQSWLGPAIVISGARCDQFLAEFV